MLLLMHLRNGAPQMLVIYIFEGTGKRIVDFAGHPWRLLGTYPLTTGGCLRVFREVSEGLPVPFLHDLTDPRQAYRLPLPDLDQIQQILTLLPRVEREEDEEG